MDEHKEPIDNQDNQYDPDKTLTVTDAKKAIHETDGHGESKNISRKMKTLPRSVPVLPSSLKDAPLTESQVAALRRVRVNRILMRRRRHVRGQSNLAPRLMIAAVVIFLLLIISLSSSGGAAYAYYNAQLPLLNSIATHSLFQTTHIYDRNGTLLYDLYNSQDGYGRRTYVNYKDIPQSLVNATIAAEDHTFYTNSGVDLQGIVRAAVSNAQSNGVVEGGSTVTQQLVKNQLFANQPRTVQIKAEEALLAYGLTQQYPKWKIMEMYLNTVYYGDLNYGVEAAAQDFFNIQPKCSKQGCISAVSQLDLAQSSFLAGLPQSPSYYNPVVNKPVALERQKKVLQAMVSLGMITNAQADQASNEMAQHTFKSYSVLHTTQAPHFVRYVIDQVLIPLIGAQNLYDGGYNIYTTIDLKLEKKIEQMTYDHLYKQQVDNYLGVYGPLNLTNNVNNAAVVVINPVNGEILAMNGSADYNNNNPTVRGQYNAAIALRQPGSSFKPIIYATAFEMGWYPAMIIPDHKTTYPSELSGNPPSYYTPQNYDSMFHSSFPMTARKAIGNSFNIPAIDTLEYAGIPNVLNMAGRLGLSEVASYPKNRLGPSMALGVTEVSLLHLTGAYGTFANQGVHVPSTAILEITDNQGNPLYTYDAAHPHGTQAISPGVAFLMSSMLSDKTARYPEFGPGNPLELNRPAAAKTGTTNSFRDNWTMGFTPHIAVGVWAGNSDNSIMNNVIGITGAGPIWHDVMDYVSNYYHFPADNFVKPDNVHSGVVSAYTGLLPHPGEPTITDWFIDGTMPTISGSNYSVGSPGGDGGCNNQYCKPPCSGRRCQGPPPTG